MASNTPSSVQLIIRGVATEDHKVLKAAAALQGKTLRQFVLDAALVVARQQMERS